MLGRTIAHYRIIEKLGAGGMGEVFKAEDLALGRLVALKFLPPSMAGDRVAVERLRREARTASTLNHQGICTIHAIEEFDGQQFIAMELLDGQPLSQLIAAGPLPLSTLLPLAIQIADALEAAHHHGIVHRDIKPGNIFVSRRHQAKILDFGLVKASAAEVSHEHGDEVTIGAESLTTTPGMTVGTIAYMSPEQARGEPLDARTDLFSFGLVLYEMATGRRAFGGTTTAIVFDGILNRMPPPVAEVSPSTPPELDRIIGKALEKERELRYQTARDLGTDLQRLKRDTESSRTVAARPLAPATGTQGAPGSAGLVPSASASVSVASASGLRPVDVPAGTAPLSGTVPPFPVPSSGTVAAAGMSRLSRALVLACVLVIIGLIAVVSNLAGRIQERGASTAQASTGTPSSVAPAPEPTPVAANSATPAASAPAAPAPAPAVPSADDERAKAAAAVAAEFEDIRGKLGVKQYAQAIVALQSFIEQHPAHRLVPDAYMLLGNAFEASDRNDEALAAYASVVEKFKTSARAPEALFHQAQRVLRSRQPQREPLARQLFTQVAADYPRSDWAPRALLARAQLEERTRERVMDQSIGARVPVALPTYRTIAERYPTQSEDALWKMSAIFEDLDRYPLQAQALLDLATRFPRTNYDAYWKLGEVRERRLKDKAGAIDAYSKVPVTSSKYRNAQRKVQDLR